MILRKFAFAFSASLLSASLLTSPAIVAAQQGAPDLAVETAKLEDLRSIREIKHLQSRWGHLALGGDWKAMAELAADDAVLAMRYGEITGRGGIESWLRTTQGQGENGIPAGRFNVRLYMSPVVTLESYGQAATARWHEIVLTGEVGGEADWQGVTHVIQYGRVDGEWKITHIRPYEHFSGSYADGWMHDAETLERAPYHYTPDEAGILLPERRAAEAMEPSEIARDATLLLSQSEAQNTVNAYGYYLDRGKYDDIVDLFSPDALIEQGGQGSWSGKEGVRAFLTRFGEAGMDTGELNDRPQLMPIASIAGDGSMALVRNVELGMIGQHGGEGQWQVSMQTFLLRPDDNGKWRIELMHRSPIMRSDYVDGWTKPLPAALPIVAGGEPTGTTKLGTVDFRDNGYNIPTLGANMVLGDPQDAGMIEVTKNALAKAEAFDGGENVSNAYGYYIDQFDWPGTAAIFSSDGWKELSYIGTFIGKERVLGSLIQRYGLGGPNDAFQAIHQKTQPFVTLQDDSGEKAFIRNRLLQFNSSAAGSGSWISGIYENQIVKEDGIWRIHGMDLDYAWLGDYSTGWTGIDPEASTRFGPGEDIIAEFAPDAPLRGESFAPFPRVVSVGFHFDNPVSGRAPETRLTWSDGHRDTPSE